MSDVASNALAGAGSGGGGMVLKDTWNPWYIQNTHTVHYCLDRDPAQFLVDEATVDDMIDTAWVAWRQELALADVNKLVVVPIVVGTQELTRDPVCLESTDLRFQLGRLLPSQRQNIDDLDSTIAVTVRTGYDRQQLRGKGFIYVVGDAGPVGQPSRVTNTWSRANGDVLYYTLVHELGHVFGLPDSGRNAGVMSYDFVENEFTAAATTPSNQPARSRVGFGVFKSVRTLLDRCLPADPTGLRQRYLGIAPTPLRSAGPDCVPVEIDFEAETNRLTVQAPSQSDDDDPIVEVGSAVMTATAGGYCTDVIRMWLPVEQRVFDVSTANKVQLPEIYTVAFRCPLELQGLYTVKGTNRTMPLYLKYDQELSLSGAAEGKLLPDLLNPARFKAKN